MEQRPFTSPELLQPQLAQQAQQAPPAQLAPPPVFKAQQVVEVVPNREWKEPWYACLFDWTGWAAFLLTSFLPFAAFGWNRYRAFPKYAVIWGIAAFLCFAGVIVFPVTVTEKYCADEYYSYSYYSGYYYSWCYETRKRPKKIAYVLMGICGIVILGMGYVNRIQLRKKFGLPGNNGTDFLRWFFCASCSLYQETRTLWQNRVENGVWQGPHQMTGSVKVTTTELPHQNQNPPAAQSQSPIFQQHQPPYQHHNSPSAPSFQECHPQHPSQYPPTTGAPTMRRDFQQYQPHYQDYQPQYQYSPAIPSPQQYQPSYSSQHMHPPASSAPTMELASYQHPYQGEHSAPPIMQPPPQQQEQERHGGTFQHDSKPSEE